MENRLKKLDALYVEPAENNAVSLQPVENMIFLKHDSRVGTTALLLPKGEDEEKKEVEIESIEFIPLLRAKLIKKGSLSSNPTFGNIYSLYDYDDNVANPLGLSMKSEAYKKYEATTKTRLFGVIRSINGKSANTAIPELQEIFNDEPIPCIFDLTTAKAKELKRVAETGIFEGKRITLTSGKDKTLIQKTKKQNYYLPIFEVNTLTEKQENKMLGYVENYFNDLAEYKEKVEENDKFLKALFFAGYTNPEHLATFQNLGIHTESDFKKWQEEQGITSDELKENFKENSVIVTESDVDEDEDDDLPF